MTSPNSKWLDELENFLSVQADYYNNAKAENMASFYDNMLRALRAERARTEALQLQVLEADERDDDDESVEELFAEFLEHRKARG